MRTVLAAVLAGLCLAASAAAGTLKPQATPGGMIYAPFSWSASGYADPDGYVGLHIAVDGGYQTSGHIVIDCGSGYQKSAAWDSDNALSQPRTGIYEASVYVPRADAIGRACTASIVVDTGNILFGGQYFLSPRPAKH